ncbi:MAG: TetR/AcrR family transcriptional regulator [Nocardioides sp.]|uniref:TetR/AcrR family transcriptional regulator n=1 Tax=Nocardioides sp. TaxID=35761 RepID=UPI0039E3C06F
MTSPRPHRRGEHVRRSVLAAAFDELVARGANDASISGIAQRAGVHETTIYRRWVTRERLLLEAVLDRSAAAVPLPDTGSTREDLREILRGVVAYFDAPSGRALLGTGVLREEFAEYRHSFWNERMTALHPVVERGIERGDLRPDLDATLVLEALVAPAHTRMLLTGEPVHEPVITAIVDLLLDGARPRPNPCQ